MIDYLPILFRQPTHFYPRLQQAIVASFFYCIIKFFHSPSSIDFCFLIVSLTTEFSRGCGIAVTAVMSLSTRSSTLSGLFEHTVSLRYAQSSGKEKKIIITIIRSTSSHRRLNSYCCQIRSRFTFWRRGRWLRFWFWFNHWFWFEYFVVALRVFRRVRHIARDRFAFGGQTVVGLFVFGTFAVFSFGLFYFINRREKYNCLIYLLLN